MLYRNKKVNKKNFFRVNSFIYINYMAKRSWSVEKKGYHYPKSPDTLREDELPKAKRCRPGDGMQSPRGSRCFNKHGKMANGGLVAKKPCDYPKRLCSFPSASRKPKSPAPRRRKSAAPVSKRAASPPSARKTPAKYKPQPVFDKQSININVNVPPSKAQGKKTIHNHYYYYLPGYPPPGQGNGGYPPPETGGYPPQGPDNLYKDYDFDLSDDFISDNDDDSDIDNDDDSDINNDDDLDIDIVLPPPFPNGPMPYLGTGHRHRPYVPGPRGPQAPPGPLGLGPGRRRVQKLPDWFLQLILMLIGLFLKNFLPPSVPSPAGAPSGSSPAEAMNIAVPATAPHPPGSVAASSPVPVVPAQTGNETGLLDIIRDMVAKFPLSPQQHQPSQMGEAEIVGSIMDKIPAIIAATRPDAPGFPEAIVTALTSNAASLASISERLAAQVAPPAPAIDPSFSVKLDRITNSLDSLPDRFANIHFRPIQPYNDQVLAAINALENRPAPGPDNILIAALNNNTAAMNSFVNRPPVADITPAVTQKLDALSNAINNLPGRRPEVVENTVALAAIKALRKNTETISSFLGHPPAPGDNSQVVAAMESTTAAINRLPETISAIVAESRVTTASERPPANDLSDIRNRLDDTNRVITAQLTESNATVRELIGKMSGPQDISATVKEILATIAPIIHRDQEEARSADSRQTIADTVHEVLKNLPHISRLGETEGPSERVAIVSEISTMAEKLTSAIASQQTPLVDLVKELVPLVRRDVENSDRRLNEAVQEGNRRVDTAVQSGDRRLKEELSAEKERFELLMGQNDKAIGLSRDAMAVNARNGDAIRDALDKVERLATAMGGTVEKLFSQTLAALPAMMAERDSKNDQLLKSITELIDRITQANSALATEASRRLQTIADTVSSQVETATTAMTNVFSSQLAEIVKKVEEGSQRDSAVTQQIPDLQRQLQVANEREASALREHIQALEEERFRHVEDIRTDSDRLTATIKEVLARESSERERNLERFTAILLSHDQSLKGIVDANNQFLESTRARAAEEMQKALSDRDRTNRDFVETLKSVMEKASVDNTKSLQGATLLIQKTAKETVDRADRDIAAMRRDFLERMTVFEQEKVRKESEYRQEIARLNEQLREARTADVAALRENIETITAQYRREREDRDLWHRGETERHVAEINSILGREAAEREASARTLQAVMASNGENLEKVLDSQKTFLDAAQASVATAAENFSGLLRANNDAQGQSFQRLLETYRDSVNQVLTERDRKNDIFINEMMQLLSQIRQQGPQQDLRSSIGALEKEKKISKKAEEIVEKAQASINEIKNEIYQMAEEVSTQLEKIAKNGQEVERHLQERARSLETHLAHVEEKNRALEKAGIDRDTLRENIANERQRSVERMKAEMEILIRDFNISLSKKNDKEQKSWKKAVKKLKKKIADLSGQTGRIERAPQIKNSTKHLGTLAKSLEHYSNSVEILESLENLTAPDPASSTSQIASISQEIGQYDQSMEILNDLQRITPPATSSQTVGLAETSRAIVQYSQSREIVNALQTITPPATSSQTVWLAETSRAIVQYSQSREIVNALQTITPPATSSQTVWLAETSRAIVQYSQLSEIVNALQTITPPATSSQTVGLAETSRAIVQYDQSMEILNDLQRITPPATSSQTVGLAETSRAIVLYGQSTVIVNDLQRITPSATSSQTVGLVDISRAIVQYSQSREIVNDLQRITPPATSSQTAGLVETSRAIVQYKEIIAFIGLLNEINAPVPMSSTGQLAAISMEIERYEELKTTVGALTHINPPATSSQTAGLAETSRAIVQYGQSTVIVNALRAITPLAASTQTAGFANVSQAIVQYNDTNAIVNALRAITPLAASTQTAGFANVSQAIVQYNDTNAIVNALRAITPLAASTQTAGLVETSRALAQLSYITAQNNDLAQLENKEQERRSEKAKAAEDRLAEEFSGVRDLTEAGRSRRSLRNLVGKQAVKMQDNLVNEFSGVSELASAVASRNAIKVIPKRIAKKRQFSLIGEFESLSELTDAKELRKQTENIEKSLYKKKRENGHANLVKKMNESLYENFRREVKADIVITVSPDLRRKILEKHPISANRVEEKEVNPTAKIIDARRSERTKGVKVDYTGQSTVNSRGKKRTLSRVYAKSPTPEMKRKKQVKSQTPIKVTKENKNDPKIIAAVQEAERRINLLKRIKDEENQWKNEEQKVNAIEPAKKKIK